MNATSLWNMSSSLEGFALENTMMTRARAEHSVVFLFLGCAPRCWFVTVGLVFELKWVFFWLVVFAAYAMRALSTASVLFQNGRPSSFFSLFFFSFPSSSTLPKLTNFVTGAF